jgi:hypothetical protein
LRGKKIQLALVLILCFLVAPGAHLRGSDSSLDRETFRSVKALYVVVSVPADGSLHGEQIRGDIVELLRSADVKVIDADRSSLALPCLFVSTNILKRQDGSWIYEVSVSVNQEVTIISTKRSYMASTWSVTTLATAASSAAPGFIRSDISNLAEKFVHAYRSVNPR